MTERKIGENLVYFLVSCEHCYIRNEGNTDYVWLITRNVTYLSTPVLDLVSGRFLLLAVVVTCFFLEVLNLALSDAKR